MWSVGMVRWDGLGGLRDLLQPERFCGSKLEQGVEMKPFCWPFAAVHCRTVAGEQRGVLKINSLMLVKLLDAVVINPVEEACP